jgi:hypothetical protein
MTSAYSLLTVLAAYITDSSTFPSTMWVAVPDLTSKRTNNDNQYELQQVSVGGFFHGSCLSEVTTSCCNTVLILMVARQQLKVNNDHFYFHGWCKVEKSVSDRI